jgi:hypothetical protein
VRLELTTPALSIGHRRLPIPERNAATDHSALVNLPAEPGHLELPAMEPVLRWTDGTVLACLYTVDTPDLRRAVAQDFDLLVSDGRVCGWLLHRPAKYASTEPWLLHDFFALITAETFERMDVEDEDTLKALRSLADRSGGHPEIHDHLVDLIDFFYG